MLFVLFDTFWSVSMLFGRFGCVWYVLARVHAVLTDFDVFGTCWSVSMVFARFRSKWVETGSSPEVTRRFPGGSPEVPPFCSCVPKTNEFGVFQSFWQRFARIGLV